MKTITSKNELIGMKSLSNYDWSMPDRNNLVTYTPVELIKVQDNAMVTDEKGPYGSTMSIHIKDLVHHKPSIKQDLIPQSLLKKMSKFTSKKKSKSLFVITGGYTNHLLE